MEPLFNPDSPTFIVGGGASLRDFDWKRLQGWQTVAVNTAFRTATSADLLFFGDDRFFDWHKDGGGQHFWRWNGKRCLTTAPKMKDGLGRIQYVDPASLVIGSGKKAFCAANSNSGVKAIVLARLLGAGQIVLLGFDNTPGHWHDGTIMAHRIQASREVYSRYAEDMEKLAKAMDGIVNAGPKSALTCFPAVTLDQILNPINN